MHNRLAVVKKNKKGGIADPHSENKTVKTADSTFSANPLLTAVQRETCRENINTVCVYIYIK